MPKNKIALWLFVICFISTPTSASIFFSKDRISGENVESSYAPRVALLVGNADYENQPLGTPLNDVRTLGDLLLRAGFDIIQVENATRSELERALNEMQHRLGDSGVGLFYFAGHGFQSENVSYILPIDAETNSQETATRSAISVNHIIRQMSSRRTGKINLVILDTCLNNPFTNQTTDGKTPDIEATLAQMLPDQSLIAFSTGNGMKAFDGDGKHGVYARELIRILPETELTTSEIFTHVQTAVIKQTSAKQTPWILSSLRSQFRPTHLSGTTNPSPLLKTAPIPEHKLRNMKTRGILPKDGDAQFELEFWQSIKDSTHAADYEAYLQAYPNGKFAPLAKSRAARYKEKPRPTVNTPSISIKGMDVGYEVVRNANIRETPSAKSSWLGELRKGTNVHVIGRVTNKNWYQVEASGVTGFVYGELLSKPKQEMVQQLQSHTPSKLKEPSIAVPQSKITHDLETIQDCALCPELVVVPAGTFTMGDDHGHRSEKPAHKVSIKQAFAIGKTEVTVQQWNECHKAGGCEYKPNDHDTPDKTAVSDISWSDAQKFLRWLSITTGQKYRLPTEAEWEYAARAGSQTRFWWGSNVGQGHADCKNCGGKWNARTPAAIDSYPANPFGLYGVSGGVWEWVSDCWHKSHKGAPNDGSSRNRSDCRENVIRGGAWRNDATYVSSASRFKYDSHVRYIQNGFRVAKTLE